MDLLYTSEEVGLVKITDIDEIELSHQPTLSVHYSLQHPTTFTSSTGEPKGRRRGIPCDPVRLRVSNQHHNTSCPLFPSRGGVCRMTNDE